jgi:hypothetical protein
VSVATMSGTGDGASSSGTIEARGRRFIVMIDGNQEGPPAGSIQAAAERLAHGIGNRLPQNPQVWSARAACPEHGVQVGVNLGPGGGGELHPCARRVLRDRPLASLEAALEALARVIGQCCR